MPVHDVCDDSARPADDDDDSLKIRYVLPNTRRVGKRGKCIRLLFGGGFRLLLFFFFFHFLQLVLSRNSIVIIIVIEEISAVRFAQWRKTYTSASDLFHKHNKPRAAGTYLCWRCARPVCALNTHSCIHICVYVFFFYQIPATPVVDHREIRRMTSWEKHTLHTPFVYMI